MRSGFLASLFARSAHDMIISFAVNRERISSSFRRREWSGKYRGTQHLGYPTLHPVGIGPTTNARSAATAMGFATQSASAAAYVSKGFNLELHWLRFEQYRQAPRPAQAPK